MPNLSFFEIALLEESRQALGTKEIALESEPIAGGYMSFSGPGSWSNQACGLGLAGPVGQNEIDHLVNFYVSRGVEPRIEVCSYADQSLLDGLAKYGFTLREFEEVFAYELTNDENLETLMPEIVGLTIKHINPQNDDEVKTFIDVSSSGFRQLDEPIDPNSFAISQRTVKHQRCDSFLAYIDEQPAGGGGMETNGDIACLFGTSVLPQFRRRGIQQALIVRRLQQAQQKGARVVCIHSKPGISTGRNAMRLGFFLAYTKVVLAMSRHDLIPSP